MTRRGFLGGLVSLPFLGFAKRGKASPVEVESSPVPQDETTHTRRGTEFHHTNIPDFALINPNRKAYFITENRQYDSLAEAYENIRDGETIFCQHLAAPKGGV